MKKVTKTTLYNFSKLKNIPINRTYYEVRGLNLPPKIPP